MMRSATRRGCSTEIVWWVTTPGMRILPSGSLTFFPHSPFVLVAHVRRLDRVGAGVDAQDEVDDVLQRRVGDVRGVPAAVAEVVADAVLGDAAQGVVERLDAQLGPLAIGLRALRHEVVVGVGEHGVVDLEDEAGLRDGEVLVAQGVGEGVDVLLFRLVVVVDAVEGGAGRRDDRQEGLFDAGSSSAALRLAMSRWMLWLST